MKNVLTFILVFFSFISVNAQTGGFDVLGGSIDYSKPKEYEIGPIRIIGADNFDHSAIKVIAGLRQGSTVKIPGEDISKAIKNLWDEGLFSDVQIYADKVVGDVIYLTYALKPRPKLSRFKFVGVNKKEADKIREEIGLFSGKNITENLIFSTKAKIKGFYREKGHYAVKVDIKRQEDDLMNNSEMFVITVEKGKKVGIEAINIYDVESMKVQKLRRAMKDTKQRAFYRIFKRSKFSVSAFQRDKKLLLDKLKEIGFRDAEIVRDSVYQIDDKNLVIDITVDEGNKYYFGNINWVGNAKYRSGYLDTILGIKRGDTYNKGLLEQRLFQSADGRDITSLYMDKGHLFFQIIPIETGVYDNHIDYEMRIIEGKEARVKNIVIKGNVKTNEHVIRREIRTKPGDLFNRNDIIRTQRELSQLGYFDDQQFNVVPIPNPQDGTVDIEYTVVEKSSDQIELSGGYGAGRLIGTLGLTFNNFSVQNMFKKEAWQPLPAGDGQKLSIRAQTNGRFYQAYNFSFTEPWLGGKKPNSFSFWVNHSSFARSNLKKSDPDYSGVSISGAGIGLGRRKKIPDDYFQAYYELAYQYYDVSNYGAIFAFDDGYSNNISLKYVLSRNSVDSPIYPKSGSKLTFSAKGTLPYSYFDGIDDYSSLSDQELNKYTEYYKLKFTGEWYLPLSGDKKLVLMPRFGFGFLGAYSEEKGVSPFERLYLGGSGLTGTTQLDGREIIAMRGYDDLELSSALGDPLISKFTVELRYPISLNPSATFYVLAFGEAANTYTTWKSFSPFNVKRSAGLGLRVFLPMFGMLGLDYGWGFDGLDQHSKGYGTGLDAQRRANGYAGKFTFSIGMNLGEL